MLSLMVLDDRFRRGRYLRTPLENGDSEAIVMSYIRQSIFMFLRYFDSFKTRFIRKKQMGQSGNIREAMGLLRHITFHCSVE